MIMQSLGQASGVPVQFLAPPPSTPAGTLVSMKVHFSLVLCMYVGLRAVVDVSVRAVVSCRFWKPPRTGEAVKNKATFRGRLGVTRRWAEASRGS